MVVWGIAGFRLASSAGCALSQSIVQLLAFRALQGLSAGAGIVVSHKVIRDLFAPAEAHKVTSWGVIYFGVAPAAQIRRGFAVRASMLVPNLAANALWPPDAL